MRDGWIDPAVLARRSFITCCQLARSTLISASFGPHWSGLNYQILHAVGRRTNQHTAIQPEAIGTVHRIGR